MAVLKAEATKGHDCDSADPETRRQWGCDGLSEFDQWECAGFKFNRCPGWYLKEGSEWLKHSFRLYNWRDNGFLPFAGTFLEQPNKYIELCEFIDFLMRLKVENEQRSRVRNKATPKR